MSKTPRRNQRRALIVVQDQAVDFDPRVLSEARTLRDAGWRVTVVCPQGYDVRRWHEGKDGLEIYRYPAPKPGSGVLGYIREYGVAIPSILLLAILARGRRKFDVAHFCSPPDLLFPVAQAMRALGSHVAYDQHDLNPELYVAKGGRPGGFFHRLLLWSERRMYRAASVVIATNETYKRFAEERGGFDPRRVFVVRSAPNSERIHPVEPRPELREGRNHLIAYLGNMGSQDGVDLLIEAAARVEAAKPGQVKFTIMGRGSELENLRELAEKRGLAGAIEFTGRAPDELVREVLSTADVGVSPDPANGFNEYCTMNKTLEYMACATPVVAFDLTETRASAGDAAVYAAPNDPAELARLILELLDDPQRRQHMGEIGRERICGPLSWNVSAQNLLAAYDSAVAISPNEGRL